ncbi:MFS transporter [Nonomuraea sp. NEAU-A123]|uniref:MFS transporter n=1 Tax=Nonomuraea sp. NEAU-A123 TaxID=2839649 RepID=UPI001BE486D2|nr:MFS transporter [Nonomuraea sp. NEAU-A123]MBT2226544.1 MFS transporter [Nonomuraea sp. NEAU-A123]
MTSTQDSWRQVGVTRARMPLRLARSASFTVVCVALSAIGHWLAGGNAPGPAMVAGAGAVVLAAATAMAGRERSRPLIIGLLGTAQVGLHVLFASQGETPHLAGVHGQSTWPGMFLCHAVATLLTAWWLAGGEAALWSLLRRLAARAVRILPPVNDPMWPLAAPVAADLVSDRPREHMLRYAVVRRGPPFRSA